MKNRVCRLYGQNDLRIEEIPVERPAAGQVLVAVGVGGICGSDQHYFSQGGIGVIRVREPIILGHEAAGTIVELGEGVGGLSVGDRVAMKPSHPCGKCRYCTTGFDAALARDSVVACAALDLHIRNGLSHALEAMPMAE